MLRISSLKKYLRASVTATVAELIFCLCVKRILYGGTQGTLSDVTKGAAPPNLVSLFTCICQKACQNLNGLTYPNTYQSLGPKHNATHASFYRAGYYLFDRGQRLK